jgi:hypothetical protein
MQHPLPIHGGDRRIHRSGPRQLSNNVWLFAKTVTRGAHHVKDARLTIEDALGHIPGRLA